MIEGATGARVVHVSMYGTMMLHALPGPVVIEMLNARRSERHMGARCDIPQCSVGT